MNTAINNGVVMKRHCLLMKRLCVLTWERILKLMKKK